MTFSYLKIGPFTVDLAGFFPTTSMFQRLFTVPMFFQSWWGLWTLEDKLLGVASTTLVFVWYLLIGYAFSCLAYVLQVNSGRQKIRSSLRHC
jgi:hypothetical protein